MAIIIGSMSFDINSDILLSNFYGGATIRLSFKPYTKNQTWYYRLKCTASQLGPNNFPTIYINLGAHSFSDKSIWTNSYGIGKIEKESHVETSFEELFTVFHQLSSFSLTATLQSSLSEDFSGTYRESAEQRLLTIKMLPNIVFSPAWSVPTWIDTRNTDTDSAINKISGSNQKAVQGSSVIQFTLPEATPRYGTSIDCYRVSVQGGYSVTFTPAQLQPVNGRVYLSLREYRKLVGDVSVTFSVEDTRGMITSYTQILTVVPYKQVYLTSNNTHRQGGTGTTLILDFEGKWYGDPLTLSCLGITAFEGDSATPIYSLSPEISISGSSFSYKPLNGWKNARFESDTSYRIEAVFTDGIHQVTLSFVIPVGIPVLAIRQDKVGIQTPSPQYTLDVRGRIAQNEVPILGYGGTIGTTDSANLNDLTVTGFYLYRGNSEDVYNFPNTSNNNSPFILRVIAIDSYIVQILHYTNTGMEFVRTYENGWNSWR